MSADLAFRGHDTHAGNYAELVKLLSRLQTVTRCVFLWCLDFLVVSTSAFNFLERLVSEMTLHFVLIGT